MLAGTLTITFGVVVILMMIAFIVGLILGVSMGRPHVTR
jgi:hypothetical protein